jgi:MFS superfamily sulfate permease-like transporter
VNVGSRLRSGGGDGRAGWVREISGGFADLGTFLPLVIGLLMLGSYDACGVLVGFGVFAIATGLFYRRPIPAQPMKAVAAVAITGGMGAAAVTASGLVIGTVLLVLGVSGLINRLQRLVPRTVLLGIQFGLGLSLLTTSASLAGGHQWLSLAALAGLAALQLTALRAAGCLILIVGAILWSLAFGAAHLPEGPIGWHVPGLVAFDLSSMREALETAVFPQLALTVTNAVLLTAALSADYFPGSQDRVSPRNLALTSGALNFLLVPFGAVPMCHGAGGLAAQFAQGARTGLAPIAFGCTCMLLGVLAGPQALAWLSLVPIPIVAALLAFAAFQLADVRRLDNLRGACLAIIALTALTSVCVNVATGLVLGTIAEYLRSRVIARRQPSGSSEAP